tara:strand:+ start:400 stop:1017 length:618 start_codon:yes stop_codon:yes gene_type:complete
MNKLITVIDGFCSRIDEVRKSALESGFGTWAPNRGEVGSSNYEGMNFWGRHSLMLKSLAVAINSAPFPNSVFFRVSNEDTERAYVHSDREWGDTTCVAYLSEHSSVSGTGFFRHRRTGLTVMPTFEEMKELGIFEELKEDMVSGGEDKWEQLDFVRGLYNRAVIFHAPLFHARCPKHGIGNDEVGGRMIWGCHFKTFTPQEMQNV